jgi:hypothetical protein
MTGPPDEGAARGERAAPNDPHGFGGDENTGKHRTPATSAQEPELFGAVAQPEPQLTGPLLTQGRRHDAHGALAARIALTRPGQASWANPELGKTCRECIHLYGGQAHPARHKLGELLPEICKRYVALMPGMTMKLALNRKLQIPHNSNPIRLHPAASQATGHRSGCGPRSPARAGSRRARAGARAGLVSRTFRHNPRPRRLASFTSASNRTRPTPRPRAPSCTAMDASGVLPST